VNASRLDCDHKRTNFGNQSGLFGAQQNTEAANHLDPIQACHLPGSIIIHQQAVGVQVFVERHGFELPSPQAGNRDDKVLKVNLDDSCPQIGIQPFCFGLAGHRTFPENGGRNTNVPEKMVEE